MCGFAAVVAPDGVSATTGWDMLDVLRHRGPDGCGVVSFGSDARLFRDRAETDGRARVVLAHARLAIIDLSDRGLEPMTNEDRSLWVAYNGEIYNFRRLRRELEHEGYRFVSDTDTEVIVHGWHAWGDGLLSRIEGMFAFALHDRRNGETVLARDRAGIKPLYWSRLADGSIAAASEIKAILAAGARRELDVSGLDQYLTWLWAPDPWTAFAGIEKLEPGHVLRVDAGGHATIRRYWDLEWVDGAAPTAEELRAAVAAAVDRQLMSDVPLGAFFSGGLDSTAIVEHMKGAGGSPPTCFTVGFAPDDLAHDVVVDDLRHSRRYAELGGIDYREAIMSPSLAEVLPAAIWHLDEPIADPAALSAYEIARVAREAGFTVLLSGVGGDEIFGGYPRYVATALAARWRRLPRPVQRLLAAGVGLLPAAGTARLSTAGRHAKKLLRGADRPFPHDYLSFLRYLDAEEKRSLYGPELTAALGLDAEREQERHLAVVTGRPWLDQAMYLDFKTFLPALNLTYMDKMAMAHSIEVRVPLLDELVVDVMRRVPPDGRLDGRSTKVLFKEAMRGVLPDDVIDRRKAGFTAPVRSWLAAGSASFVDDVLSADTVRRRGLFQVDGVNRLRADFRSGRRDTALQIWQLVTIELWHQIFVDGSLRPGDPPALKVESRMAKSDGP